MNFLILDLELNQPTQSIIQIGAVVGNLESGEVLEQLSVYVRPYPEETISDFIVKLTGIDNALIDERGAHLTQGFKSVLDLHSRHRCFKNVVTWGGNDAQLLINQTQAKDSSINPLVFGYRWIDLKTAFQMYQFSNNRASRGGLKGALRSVGLSFKGRQHDALDDAYNTWLMMLRLKALFEESVSRKI